jgi:uncharacterized membrane protein YedE/YeeE/rhodanese-related sulfurtransferase
MIPDSVHPAVTAIPIGIAFGVILERAGLGDPRVIAGQLLGRDFTVVRVMFGAIVTAMLGVVWAHSAGWLDAGMIAIPPTDLPAQALGAVIFGGGFALAALCPGTACVAAASGRRDGLAAVGGMFAGTALTPITWPVVRSAVSDVPREGATLVSDTGLPLGVIVVLLTVAAVLATVVGRLMEGRERMSAAWRPRTPESVALALAATFAIADGRGSLPSSRADVIASEIESEADHIDALDLAQLIKSREPGLRILDLRERLDTSTYLIPGAIAISMKDLDTVRVAPGERLVLYSDGGAHAAQAWVLLRVRGLRDVLVLKDGMAAWEDEVLSPLLPSVPDDSAKARFGRAKELSLWFGGFPRLVPDESSPSSAPRARRRRTC